MNSKTLLFVAVGITGALYYQEYTSKESDEEYQEAPPQAYFRHGVTRQPAIKQDNINNGSEFDSGFNWADENKLNEIKFCSGESDDFVRGCVEYVIRKRSKQKS